MRVFSDAIREMLSKNKDISDLSENRMKYCRNCSYFTNTGQCAYCGCFLKLKTKIKEEKCPIGRW